MYYDPIEELNRLPYKINPDDIKLEKAEFTEPAPDDPEINAALEELYQDEERAMRILQRLYFPVDLIIRLSGSDNDFTVELYPATLDPYWKELLSGYPRIYELADLFAVAYHTVSNTYDNIPKENQGFYTERLAFALHTSMKIVEVCSEKDFPIRDSLSICDAVDLMLSSVPKELRGWDGNQQGNSIWGQWEYDKEIFADKAFDRDLRKNFFKKNVIIHCKSWMHILYALIRYCAMACIKWRFCEICGNIFMPTAHQSKYCSKACQNKAIEMNSESRALADKITTSLNKARYNFAKKGGAKSEDIRTEEAKQLHERWKAINDAMKAAVKDELSELEYQKWIKNAFAKKSNGTKALDAFLDETLIQYTFIDGIIEKRNEDRKKRKEREAYKTSRAKRKHST